MSKFIESDINEVNSRFKSKKIQAGKVSDSLARVGFPERSDKLASCSDVLQFRHDVNVCTGDIEEHGRLYYSFFCKDKLCPICNWRRSVKIFCQVGQIMEKVDVNKYKFIFLTLTVPNCKGDELRATIDMIQKSWSKFMRKKHPSQFFKGYIKSLEITYNQLEDTYHPHLHIIIAVPKSYGKKVYFSKDTILQWWKEATKNQLIKIIDVRLVYNKHYDKSISLDVDYKSAVAELCKYPLKFPSILSDKMVYTYATELTNLRFVDYGGLFKRIKKELTLDDTENGDLIHVEASEEASRHAYCLITKFKWQVGIYNLIDTQYDTI